MIVSIHNYSYIQVYNALRVREDKTDELCPPLRSYLQTLLPLGQVYTIWKVPDSEQRKPQPLFILRPEARWSILQHL